MEKGTTFKLDGAYRSALEEIPTALGLYRALDGACEPVLFSRGACRLFGGTQEELLSRFRERGGCTIHPEDYPAFSMLKTRALLHPEQPFQAAFRACVSGGGYRWLSISGESRRLEDGAWLLYVTYSPIEDTQALQCGQADTLRRSSRLFQEILDFAPAAIFWKDADRRFWGANRAFLKYYGFESDREILGKTDEDMGWHTDPGPYRGDELRVLREGAGTCRVHGQCLSHGQLRDIVASKSPLFEDGKIIGLVGSFEDVTEEYGQRERADKLRSILDNIPAGICVYRRKGEETSCIAVNRFMLEHLNVSADTVIGHDFYNWAHYLHPDDRSAFLRSRAAFLRNHEPMDGTYRIRSHGADTYSWFDVMGYYVPQEDGSALLYITHTDVSAVKAAERRAALDRQIYEDTVNAAGMVIWRYEIAARRVVMMDNRASREAAVRYGLPMVVDGAPASMTGTLEKEDIPAFLEMYRAAEQGRTAFCEVRSRGVDQSTHCERLCFTAFAYDDEDRVTAAYGMGMDVTQQKKQEELYHHEMEQLNQISGPNVIAKGHHDLTANRVLDYVANTRKALDLHTISYDDALQAMLKMPVEASDREKLAEMLDRNNLISRYYAGEQNFAMEYRRRNGDQPVTLVETTVRTFAVRENHVECFICTYDLTQKQLELGILSKLAELGYEYMGLVDVKNRTLAYYTGATGIVESTEKNPLYYDQVMELIMGRLSIETASPETLAPIALDNVLAELEKQSAYEYVFDYQDGDGTLHRKRMQYCYLTAAHTTVFFAQSDLSRQYQHDTEQMRRLRQAVMAAERANESKSMFLSSVSHDMRTPLNGIIGFTDFALRERDPVKKQNYLEKIRFSSSLLLSLVNDTLELSRIESGKVTVNPEVVNSSELLESIVVGVRITADSKNVAFSAAFGSDFPTFVRVDKLKMQEICLNLLSNAVKFTPPGGQVKFTVFLVPPQQGNLNVKITVEDTGIGIGEEFQKKMFEPFSQEHAQGMDSTLGTGLGLSIVRRYVDLLGGIIEVESGRNRGTRFTVCLPVEPVEESDGESSVPAEAETDFSGRRVLLCEDNYLNREIAAMLLQERGIQVVPAADGQEGVDRFSASAPNSFDAVLMDLRMPHVDGYEATRSIRALPRPDAAAVPIIAMTADAYEEDVRRCLESGMNSHITKPIDPARLFSELGRLLSRS